MTRISKKELGMRLLPLPLCLVAIATLAATQKKSNAAVGLWEGDSICADKLSFPNCHDEHWFNTITAVPNKPNLVHSSVDKLVNGKRELMGEFDFQFDKQRNRLKSEFNIHGNHGLWEFTINGKVMKGTLVMLPKRALVRRVNLTKH